MAFSDVVDGNTDVYVMDVQSHARQRLTSGPDMEAVPLWAPDGDVLIYTSPNGTWALPMSGSTPAGAARLLSNEAYEQPAGWTDNGSFYRVNYNISKQFLQVPMDPEAMTATGPPEVLPINQAIRGSRGFLWS